MPMPAVDSAAAAVLKKKQQYLIPSIYHFYRDPPVFEQGRGCYLIDTTGRSYLDLYTGVGAMSLGHSSAKVLAAATRQLDQLQHTSTIYLTRPMFDLAEKLAELTPGQLTRSFFCASGTEANEAALLMASQVTGREQFLAIDRGLHGRTKSAMSVTQIPMWRTDPFLLESCKCAPHFSQPDSLAVIKQELKSREYAAVIAEPIQGNGGILVPPDGFWSSLRNICTDTGTLLIADEVQSGINRTGTFFAVEQEGVVPDFVTSAKALGNGFPIAVTMTSDGIAEQCRRPAASTYGANPIACAAALAVLSEHGRHDLGRQSLEKGALLMQELQQTAKKCPLIRDVRGRGLMLGVELSSEDSPIDELTDVVLETMKDRGFLLGKTGLHRNVLTFMPPLIVGRDELSDACQTLEDVLNQL